MAGPLHHGSAIRRRNLNGQLLPHERPVAEHVDFLNLTGAVKCRRITAGLSREFLRKSGHPMVMRALARIQSVINN